jgi:hypothetical protein
MSNIFKKVDSSDYIKAKKQMTIYTNANTAPITNNFKFIPNTNNCLINALNYDLLNDYIGGEKYVNQKCDISNNNLNI